MVLTSHGLIIFVAEEGFGNIRNLRWLQKKYQKLNMCDFCSQDYPDCKAQPYFASQVIDKGPELKNQKAVIACDKYESPVDALKRQFH